MSESSYEEACLGVSESGIYKSNRNAVGTFDVPTNGILGGSGAAALRMAPVREEYGTLSQELNALGETFDRLRMQLEPVTGPDRPTSPEIDQHKSPPQEALSPLAESIRSDAALIRHITAGMRNLSSRIEV